MSEPRVIKKYPNRRLYDTVESRYITLTDIKRLVVDHVDFLVVDKKNNADITHSILLQVIGDQEHQSETLLSRDFMANLIRAYGVSQPAQVAGHLEQALKGFLVQHPLRERVKPVVAPEPPRMRAVTDEMVKVLPR